MCCGALSFRVQPFGRLEPVCAQACRTPGTDDGEDISCERDRRRPKSDAPLFSIAVLTQRARNICTTHPQDLHQHVFFRSRLTTLAHVLMPCKMAFDSLWPFFCSLAVASFSSVDVVALVKSIYATYIEYSVWVWHDVDLIVCKHRKKN